MFYSAHGSDAASPLILRERGLRPAHACVLIVYQCMKDQSFSFVCVLRRPGGYGGAAAPDPIPNSAVKRSSANGTSSQDAGE